MPNQNDALVGKSLPSVQLDSSAGGKVSLPQDLLGKWTVLYFYPKDDTPGCTKQACSYRDSIDDFTKIGTRVLGVSTDDLVSHDSFIQKFSLNFPLLADTEHKLSEALGVYGPQEWQGKVYQGVSRDTFLIDPQGTIRDVWRKVSATATMAETLEAVKKYL
ncbi:MAG: peroxiredoxin [Methylotenera sp.]|nr:peroxiredoxin [Oligoflexia bacterium]